MPRKMDPHLRHADISAALRSDGAAEFKLDHNYRYSIYLDARRVVSLLDRRKYPIFLLRSIT